MGDEPPVQPPTVITNPPRDFGPDGAPTTYFADPDVITLDPSFNALRVGNTPIKRLWTGALWAEGPAWNSVGRYLIFSDIASNKQMRWLEDTAKSPSSATRRTTATATRSTIQGRQVSAEHVTRRLVRYEHDGTVTVLASHYDGKRLNSPNDMAHHPDGSIWFTDPPWGGQLYEGTVDAPGGMTNPTGLLNPRVGQPPELGSYTRELTTNVYRSIRAAGSTWSSTSHRCQIRTASASRQTTSEAVRGAVAPGVHLFDVTPDNKAVNQRLFTRLHGQRRQVWARRRPHATSRGTSGRPATPVGTSATAA